MKLEKKAIVIHSGGMDSSICLALAIKEFHAKNVLSMSFNYNQRHQPELIQAQKICKYWDVDHVILQLDCLNQITSNALTDHQMEIDHSPGDPPNTLVVGRNGLMARLGAIHAHELGAHCLYMGIMGLEGANSGYRDCSREYMDLLEAILRIDLDKPEFEIRTPLVNMSKQNSLELAKSLGILGFLLEETITCYQGISKLGCKICPACILRNEGLRRFQLSNPSYSLPYQLNDSTSP